MHFFPFSICRVFRVVFPLWFFCECPTVWSPKRIIERNWNPPASQSHSFFMFGLPSPPPPLRRLPLPLLSPTFGRLDHHGKRASASVLAESAFQEVAPPTHIWSTVRLLLFHPPPGGSHRGLIPIVGIAKAYALGVRFQCAFNAGDNKHMFQYFMLQERRIYEKRFNIFFHCSIYSIVAFFFVLIIWFFFVNHRANQIKYLDLFGMFRPHLGLAFFSWYRNLCFIVFQVPTKRICALKPPPLRVQLSAGIGPSWFHRWPPPGALILNACGNLKFIFTINKS